MKLTCKDVHVPSQLHNHDDNVAEAQLQDAKKEIIGADGVVAEIEGEIVVIEVVYDEVGVVEVVQEQVAVFKLSKMMLL